MCTQQWLQLPPAGTSTPASPCHPAQQPAQHIGQHALVVRPRTALTADMPWRSQPPPRTAVNSPLVLQCLDSSFCSLNMSVFWPGNSTLSLSSTQQGRGRWGRSR